MLDGKRTRPARRLSLSVLLAAVVIGGGAAPAAAQDAPELDAVLLRFDEVQRTIQTLSAEFKETTSNAMLKEPIVASGRFYLTKPDSIRWEYSSPEEMRFVIASDEYTGYFPARKTAERRSIQRFSEQLFRFFGVGQASSELVKFYRIELGEAAEPDEILLLMEPKKKRARKRVETVRFWIDAATLLPRRVEYSGAGGSGRLIEFEEVQLNPDLAASLYRVELPSDVTVTKGFSGLPEFSPGSAR